MIDGTMHARDADPGRGRKPDRCALLGPDRTRQGRDATIHWQAALTDQTKADDVIRAASYNGSGSGGVQGLWMCKGPSLEACDADMQPIADPNSPLKDPSDRTRGIGLDEAVPKNRAVGIREYEIVD